MVAHQSDVQEDMSRELQRTDRLALLGIVPHSGTGDYATQRHGWSREEPAERSHVGCASLFRHQTIQRICLNTCVEVARQIGGA